MLSQQYVWINLIDLFTAFGSQNTTTQFGAGSGWSLDITDVYHPVVKSQKTIHNHKYSTIKECGHIHFESELITQLYFFWFYFWTNSYNKMHKQVAFDNLPLTPHDQIVKNSLCVRVSYAARHPKGSDFNQSS